MVPCENAADIRRVKGHIASPLAEAAVPVDGLDPLGQEFTLGLVLRRVLSLDLEHEHFAPRQPDQEVGAVLLHDALEDIHDLVAEVVVLHPRRDLLISLQLEGLGGFPSAVVDAVTDV